MSEMLPSTSKMAGEPASMQAEPEARMKLSLVSSPSMLYAERPGSVEMLPEVPARADYGPQRKAWDQNRCQGCDASQGGEPTCNANQGNIDFLTPK